MNLIFILILQEDTRFILMELKKSKKIQNDLDNTVYSVYLAQINFHAWLINGNLYNYMLEEIINNEKIKYIIKKQKKEYEASILVTRIKINHDSI